MRQRKAALDANETPIEPGGSVREVSCARSLQREMHAVCQRGASRKLHSSQMFFGLQAGGNFCNACAFSMLPDNALRNSLRDESVQNKPHFEGKQISCRVGNYIREG
jgi:hypothetical protein